MNNSPGFVVRKAVNVFCEDGDMQMQNPMHSETVSYGISVLTVWFKEGFPASGFHGAIFSPSSP